MHPFVNTKCEKERERMKDGYDFMADKETDPLDPRHMDSKAFLGAQILSELRRKSSRVKKTD